MSYVDEANAENIVKPEGSPDLWPLLKLPRRKRAIVIRQLKLLSHAQERLGLDEVKEGDEEKTLTPDEQLDMAAAASDLFADFEDLLRTVAVHEDDFAEWLETATDEHIGALSGWYMKSMQLGEAQASPAS